ncbi:ABC transporter ATP-binding protein [Kitasatospora sp. NPDC050463]|uniref:ABC transporter ATP-binding protein n=1 Tax=Kitasatospora sp. NPDC050463 TaxID=3155786 RepID=UPI0033FBB9A9
MPSSVPSADAGWLGSRIRRWRAVVELLRHAGAGLLVSAVLVHLVVGLLPIAFIAWTSRVIAEIPAATAAGGTTGAAWEKVAAALGIAVGAFVLQQLLTPFQTVISEVVTRRVDGACIGRLMDGALRALPAAELERQEVLDLLSDARSAFDRARPTPGDAAAGALALIARYAQLAGAAVMVAVTLGFLPGVMVALTALVIRFGQRGSLGRFAALLGSLAGPRRRVGYLRRAAGGTELAKETRMLGLLPWLLGRHEREARDYLEPLWTGRRRLLFWPFVGLAVVGLLGGGTALVVLARSGVDGTLSLLQLSVALQAVLIPMRFGVYFPESDVQTQYGLAAYDSLVRFEALAQDRLRVPRTAAVTAPPAVDGPPAGATRSAVTAPPAVDGPIRFEGVAFRYQEDGPDVLRGLELELPPGRSTAIVGLNGSGKTTLVKLLAGLHEPTEGRITAGGTDLAGLPAEDWQRRIAVIFQDFTRYQLTAAENIGMGRPELLGDREALLAAAERAGAAEIVQRLPKGLDTVLSTQYEGGSDLSGGQWQRIALSRALLAVDAGASLLILDEPTAQLDVRAEAAFFDRFLEMTEGITSVIIAHRFSSVRRADRIVVLADGGVVESGTHEQLMELDGRYAELFRVQAERFAREEGAGESADAEHADAEHPDDEQADDDQTDGQEEDRAMRPVGAR